MKKSIITYTLIISTLLLLNCNTKKHVGNCSDIKNGTFEIYENDKLIGHIYRSKDYQIDRYLDDERIPISKLTYKDCSIIYNIIQKRSYIDTLTWRITNTKISDKTYTFEVRTEYLDIDYVYKGKLVKLKNEISDKLILKKLDSLDKVNKKSEYKIK